MKKLLLFVALLISALPTMAATDRALWKMPSGADFKALRLRPNGKVALYWQTEKNVGKDLTFPTERVLIDGKSNKIIGQNFVGNNILNNNGTDIEFETFNSRGQHAYLPSSTDGNDTFLRLKTGNSYRVLKNLPSFTYNSFQEGTLQDLKFSPDGEVLKVLGKDRLWIVGAQTGKLLRVIRPSQGKWWSRENAALSPDGFTILGMHDRMTLFSAHSGRVRASYGIYLQSFFGHEVSVEHHLAFSPDGRKTYAYQDSSIRPGTTYEYPAIGGNLVWKGRQPRDLCSSLDGRFYLDSVETPHGYYAVVKRVSTHKTVKNFADIPYEPYMETATFSNNGKSIYFVKDNTLWQRPFKTN